MHCGNALGPMLGRCAHLARERMDARMSRFGMTPAQTHVLRYLRQNGGQMPQRELLENLKVKPSTVNGILDRMEEKGLVERSVSGTDARQRVVALTPAGLEREAEAKQSFLEAEALIAKGLTEKETETLRTLLERVIHNLEEDRNL
ncbi:MarR family winged helix-turn-helix transcriptional regulator [Oscillibacter sp.]|uniref:MarR family winged helix-turn-helix transcriptional regulator n=1 Tax=Oscillibacter sp. TaxID=1945593 RepID=UPI001B41FA4F|nr:MarR family transcriptional regulator [Oscillibacter sp.]MBP3509671.1 MarR family transcriptional regulator [Oscillibacter sp.]